MKNTTLTICIRKRSVAIAKSGACHLLLKYQRPMPRLYENTGTPSPHLAQCLPETCSLNMRASIPGNCRVCSACRFLSYASICMLPPAHMVQSVFLHSSSKKPCYPLKQMGLAFQRQWHRLIPLIIQGTQATAPAHSCRCQNLLQTGLAISRTVESSNTD